MIASFLVSLFGVLCEMAPWLLLGFFLAGLLARLLPPAKIKKYFRGGGLAAVGKAALLGVPLPLCSCGVIPLAAALRREGAAKGPAGAFFIATPQTGADNFLLTQGLLGLPVALLRAAIAFLSGVLGGVLIDRSWLPNDGLVNTISALCPQGAPHREVAEDERQFEPGVWNVRFTDRASGLSKTAQFTVKERNR